MIMMVMKESVLLSFDENNDECCPLVDEGDDDAKEFCPLFVDDYDDDDKECCPLFAYDDDDDEEMLSYCWL